MAVSIDNTIAVLSRVWYKTPPQIAYSERLSEINLRFTRSGTAIKFCEITVLQANYFKVKAILLVALLNSRQLAFSHPKG